MDGWEKLYRNLIYWEHYKDSKTKSVLIHIMLTCENDGALTISISELSDALSITEKEARRSISLLISDGKIAKIASSGSSNTYKLLTTGL